MKKICTLMLAVLLVFICSACSSKKAIAKKENKTQTDLKSLVIYFSWVGSTQNIAKEIQKQTNSDIFEIIPEVAYSDDYDTVDDDVKKEQQEKARPKIKNKIESIDEYETIYVGYPN